MQLRVARHTNRLEELVSFYRDGLGLPEIGRFEDHEGYDGVFLAVPGTDAHLEFTSGGAHRPPAPNPETLLVLYVGSEEAVAQMCERMGAGRQVVPRLVRAGFPRARSGGATLVTTIAAALGGHTTV
jgi:catechol 2,3-dioxygenase-like lactoylglutathione lyase family enzyme